VLPPADIHDKTHEIIGRHSNTVTVLSGYKGWNFNSGNYLFTTDTK